MPEDDLRVLGLDAIATNAANPPTVGFGGARQSPRMRAAIRGQQLGDADVLSRFKTDISRRADEARTLASRESAVAQLDELSPDDPQFFERAGRVFSNNPAALNDRAVMSFFNLKGGIAEDHESNRRFNVQQDRLINNENARIQSNFIDDQNKTAEELFKELQTLNSAGQAEIEAAGGFRGRTPMEAREMLAAAKVTAHQHDNRVKALELGLPEESMAKLERERFSDEAIAGELGRIESDKQVAAEREKRLDAVQSSLRRMQSDYEALNGEALNAKERSLKQRFEALQSEEFGLLGIELPESLDDSLDEEQVRERVVTPGAAAELGQVAPAKLSPAQAKATGSILLF